MNSKTRSKPSSPQDRRYKLTGWVNAVAMLAIAVAWACWAVDTLQDTTIALAGMAPILLGILLIGMLFICGITNAFYHRSFFQLAIAIAAILIVLAPIYFLFEISKQAWAEEVVRNATANEAAISATDFSDANFEYVPYKDHERMVPVVGFSWSIPEPKYPTADGKFLGFTVNGTPHVYLFPIRNGCRGLAWIKDKSFLERETEVRYFPTENDNWYFWMM